MIFSFKIDDDTLSFTQLPERQGQLNFYRPKSFFINVGNIYFTFGFNIVSGIKIFRP